MSDKDHKRKEADSGEKGSSSKKKKKNKAKNAALQDDDETAAATAAAVDAWSSSDEEELAAAVPRQAQQITRREAGEGKFLDYVKNMTLKNDHHKRPVWVCPDGHMFLEAFSPVYKQAYDFLVAISEPIYRQNFIHEYQLTPYSLYAAVSIGLQTSDIQSVLQKLSKNKVPDEVEDFIQRCTTSYGKVKLVLQRNRYFVESPYPDVLRVLLKDEVILAARAAVTLADAQSNQPKDLLSEFLVTKAPQEDSAPAFPVEAEVPSKDEKDAVDDILQLDDDEEDGDEEQINVHSFEIHSSHVEKVKHRGLMLDYPMVEEYDFKNDTANPDIGIDLKPSTGLRPYQEKSMSKMFGNGRARSGVIVLPCGAGKTLVGVTACCTVKKSALVLCTSNVSVLQWQQQFKMWSTIDRKCTIFTSGSKEKIRHDGVLITTFTMMTTPESIRSDESKKAMREITSREWGIIVMDEVHVVPANMFRKVIGIVKAHTKLGLTATLVREDGHIADLNFLIGPKLYEANWLDLQKAGHLARVLCSEVWCPMTAEFHREYLRRDAHKRKLLYIMNPNKFNVCQLLIRKHEEMGDKCLVFSDNIFALKRFAQKLGKYYLYGATNDDERVDILKAFQVNPMVNTVFISKIGDTSIDLPEANVIIQISSHYGSRRQEAQRLGRILRPKGGRSDEFNAFFYTLVSQDTREMYYSSKRQQFLIDQGYSFKVIPSVGDLNTADFIMGPKETQLELLAEVLAAEETDATEEVLAEDYDQKVLQRVAQRGQRPTAKRGNASMRGLSGGDSGSYVEYSTGPASSARDQQLSAALNKRKTAKHSLMKQRGR